jgi:hypothetical protein
MPGVAAVLTADDMPPSSFVRPLDVGPLLNKDRVRMVGDAVAVVAAVDVATAIKAIDAIEVQYQPLPAVFDPERAMQAGAPRLFADAPNGNIGGELCCIVHLSDSATALTALKAQARIVGPNGERLLPFDQYWVTPRQNVLKENVLEHNEILAEVVIPPPASGQKSTFLSASESRSLNRGLCWKRRTKRALMAACAGSSRLCLRGRRSPSRRVTSSRQPWFSRFPTAVLCAAP